MKLRVSWSFHTSKELDLVNRDVACHYPWEKMEEPRNKYENCDTPCLCPLTKTAFQYGEDGTNEGVITKEIPYSATELAKLQEKYSRSAKEMETDMCGESPLWEETEKDL